MVSFDRNRSAFFTYGIFKPGQLGHLRIDEVGEVQLGVTDGQLFERNGVALLDPEGTGRVGGYVILLAEPEAAYDEIRNVEPESQYREDGAEIVLRGEHSGSSIDANVFVSATTPTRRERPLHTTHDKLDCQWWDGANDPLFTHGLDRIEEVCSNTPEGLDESEPEILTEAEAKYLFDVQMAYQFLWTAVERYLLLRYADGGEVCRQDRNAMAREEAFREAVEEHVDREFDQVLDLLSPGSDPAELKESEYESILEFYWQLRNNVTHRGKGVRMEYDLLRDSLEELHAIFTDVLEHAFEAANRRPAE